MQRRVRWNRGGGPSSLRTFVEERREWAEGLRKEHAAKEMRRAAILLVLSCGPEWHGPE